MRIRLIAVLLLGGCGELAAPAAHGGVRLQVRVAVSEDGVRVPVGLHDQELDLDCSFATAADGVQRCLPPLDPPSGYYSDDACTSPLFYPWPGQKYAVTAGLHDCGRTRVFEITEPFVGTAYQLDEGGACRPSNQTGLGQPGHEPAPETFVAANEEVVPLGDRLSAIRLEGEDGSESDSPWLEDRERGETCGETTSGDGVWRCMPQRSAAFSNLYGDGGCTRPLGEVSLDPDCSPPEELRYVGDYSREEGCGVFSEHVYQAGPRPDGWFRPSGPDGCVAVQPDRHAGYLSPGTAVAPDEFARVEYAVGDGSGRLRPAVETTESGLPLRLTGAFRDTERSEWCWRGPAEDGVERCLPDFAIAWSVYSTPRCTDPVYVARVDRGSCEDPRPPSYAWDLARSVESLALDRVGDRLAESYEMVDGACVPADRDRLGSTADFYALGEPVEPSEFAPLSDELE